MEKERKPYKLPFIVSAQAKTKIEIIENSFHRRWKIAGNAGITSGLDGALQVAKLINGKKRQIKNRKNHGLYREWRPVFYGVIIKKKKRSK